MAKVKTEEINAKEETNVNENNMLDEVQAKIDAMLKAAEKKAAKIIEEATLNAGAERAKKADSGLSEEVMAEIAKNEEYVEVKLFKDTDKYKDDVYVAVGNQNCVIKRGVPVKIKRKFLLAIDESIKNDLMTAQLIERESGNFKEIN